MMVAINILRTPVPRSRTKFKIMRVILFKSHQKESINTGIDRKGLNLPVHLIVDHLTIMPIIMAVDMKMVNQHVIVSESHLITPLAGVLVIITDINEVNIVIMLALITDRLRIKGVLPLGHPILLRMVRVVNVAIDHAQGTAEL